MIFLHFCLSFGKPLLLSLSTVTPAEVYKLISGIIEKYSPFDSIPISLIKACPAVFSELVAHLANCSLKEGYVPRSFEASTSDSYTKGRWSGYKHTSKLPTYFKFKQHIKDNRKTGIGQAASALRWFPELQFGSVRLQTASLDRNGATLDD